MGLKKLIKKALFRASDMHEDLVVQLERIAVALETSAGTEKGMSGQVPVPTDIYEVEGEDADGNFGVVDVITLDDLRVLRTGAMLKVQNAARRGFPSAAKAVNAELKKQFGSSKFTKLATEEYPAMRALLQSIIDGQVCVGW